MIGDLLLKLLADPSKPPFRTTGPNTREMALEILSLRKWVADLQSGMYINCVYCGHRYGPADKVPSTMADALKAHVEQCPQHPMSELKKDAARYRWLLKRNPDYFNRIDAAMELEP